MSMQPQESKTIQEKLAEILNALDERYHRQDLQLLELCADKSESICISKEPNELFTHRFYFYVMTIIQHSLFFKHKHNRIEKAQVINTIKKDFENLFKLTDLLVAKHKSCWNDILINPLGRRCIYLLLHFSLSEEILAQKNISLNLTQALYQTTEAERDKAFLKYIEMKSTPSDSAMLEGNDFITLQQAFDAEANIDKLIHLMSIPQQHAETIPLFALRHVKHGFIKQLIEKLIVSQSSMDTWLQALNSIHLPSFVPVNYPYSKFENSSNIIMFMSFIFQDTSYFGKHYFLSMLGKNILKDHGYEWLLWILRFYQNSDANLTLSSNKKIQSILIQSCFLIIKNNLFKLPYTLDEFEFWKIAGHAFSFVGPPSIQQLHMNIHKIVEKLIEFRLFNNATQIFSNYSSLEGTGRIENPLPQSPSLDMKKLMTLVHDLSTKVQKIKLASKISFQQICSELLIKTPKSKEYRPDVIRNTFPNVIPMLTDFISESLQFILDAYCNKSLSREDVACLRQLNKKYCKFFLHFSGSEQASPTYPFVLSLSLSASTEDSEGCVGIHRFFSTPITLPKPIVKLIEQTHLLFSMQGKKLDFAFLGDGPTALFLGETPYDYDFFISNACSLQELQCVIKQLGYSNQLVGTRVPVLKISIDDIQIDITMSETSSNKSWQELIDNRRKHDDFTTSNIYCKIHDPSAPLIFLGEESLRMLRQKTISLVDNPQLVSDPEIFWIERYLRLLKTVLKYPGFTVHPKLQSSLEAHPPSVMFKQHLQEHDYLGRFGTSLENILLRFNAGEVYQKLCELGILEGISDIPTRVLLSLKDLFERFTDEKLKESTHLQTQPGYERKVALYQFLFASKYFCMSSSKDYSLNSGSKLYRKLKPKDVLCYTDIPDMFEWPSHFPQCALINLIQNIKTRLSPSDTSPVLSC